MTTLRMYDTTKAHELMEDQRSFLCHCLIQAAEEFERSASAAQGDWPKGSGEFFVHHLEQQAADARELAERIESAEFVKLGRVVE